MEDLTKQQVVLLTLLVSFVTSMATGIITVSLMDQAPAGVTQIINRVVEHTIERVASETPTSNTAVTLNPIVDATDKVSKGIVRFKPTNGTAESVTGLGIVL